MSAKRVWLDNSTPVGIQCYRALVCGADALAPVIFICEAASRPTNIGHLDGLQGSNHIVADSARIRDFGIPADPNALVNAVPKMFSKLAEDIAVNLRTWLGSIYCQLNLFRCSGRCRASQR